MLSGELGDQGDVPVEHLLLLLLVAFEKAAQLVGLISRLLGLGAGVVGCSDQLAGTMILTDLSQRVMDRLLLELVLRVEKAGVLLLHPVAGCHGGHLRRLCQAEAWRRLFKALALLVLAPLSLLLFLLSHEVEVPDLLLCMHVCPGLRLVAQLKIDQEATTLGLGHSLSYGH